jgi:hypothetical protein
MRLRQVVGVLAVVALAGCGTATALLTAGHRGGPPPGTRADALRLARRLIAENVLPPGARGLPQRPIPLGLRQVGGQAIGVKSSVDVYRLFALPVSMRQAAAFLARHAPAGTRSGGTGQSGGPGGITEMDVSYFLNRLAPGISSAGLTDTVVPARRGGSLLRIDAQVIWNPPRSAAEHIDPRDYRAVRIHAELYGHGAQHVTRTFTARGVIGRLARLLNGLPASPGGLYPCPLQLATYQLTFEPKASQPKIVVATQGCSSDTVTVGGARQPALEDFGKLTALAGQITRVRPSLVPPRA